MRRMENLCERGRREKRRKERGFDRAKNFCFKKGGERKGKMVGEREKSAWQAYFFQLLSAPPSC